MADGSTGFDPARCEVFRFSGWDYAADDARIELHYRLVPDDIEFTETIRFPDPVHRPDHETMAPRIELLHLLAGVSYYKAACPPQIEIDRPPSPAVARLVETVYRNGLGEFAYCNELTDLRRRIVLPDGTGTIAPPSKGREGIVVPLGGGKDSLVSVDLLERAGRDFRLISVGSSKLIQAVAATIDRPHLRIDRRISPRLLELNRLGALNGHVPITAILAGVMLCAAPVYGFDTVVMSNERSADSANLVLDDGFQVNHQYSKTFAFEKDFSDLVQTRIDPAFRYFSLLRGHPELAISRYFAEHCRRFHGVFSSCNGNFRLDGAAGDRWCRDCPKCRFVFLMMAPFLPPGELTAIFGANLLDDAAQAAGYAELLGLAGSKPFECVGEIAESQAALGLLLEHPAWQDMAVVRQFSGQLAPQPAGSWLTGLGETAIPAGFRELVDALG
ncbi:MAG: endonuclease domain-containing protein [Xanthomonadales bacterium]|nr:endonuclease domain-containing protein [Xanthomonadales bacterium]